VTKLALAASNFILRIFGIRTEEKKQEDIVFRKVDLDHFIGFNHTEESEPDSQKIFQNALDFSNVKLRECMIPRTEINAVESTTPVAELKERFIESGHSRILVYDNSIDNILGYFELKDIFNNPPDILSCLRKVAVVPETMAANRLLKLFVEEKNYIALVVDEFGGTSGLVTIEDILEEIVGDIEDEHDFSELTERKTGENEYIFSARHEVDYLNEEYNLFLPEGDDYETLAGMILFYHGSIPAPNDIITINNIIIKVLRVSDTRLELVNLKVT
jgi:CBS domain containing-hemolysin-like protein